MNIEYRNEAMNPKDTKHKAKILTATNKSNRE